MKNSGMGAQLTQQDLARFWQAVHDGASPPIHICGGQAAATWRWFGDLEALPKNQPKITKFAIKRTQPASRSAAQASNLWNCDRLWR
jgi:hypothetical protein